MLEELHEILDVSVGITPHVGIVHGRAKTYSSQGLYWEDLGAQVGAKHGHGGLLVDSQTKHGSATIGPGLQNGSLVRLRLPTRALKPRGQTHRESVPRDRLDRGDLEFGARRVDHPRAIEARYLSGSPFVGRLQNPAVLPVEPFRRPEAALGN